RPLEQKRLIVIPLVVIGSPDRKAIWRAMLLPVAPSGVAQPMMTSSTSSAAMPARSTAALTAWPPRVAPCVMLKAPFQLLARGVRAVETITALVMGGSCLGWCRATSLSRSPPDAARSAGRGGGSRSAERLAFGGQLRQQ